MERSFFEKDPAEMRLIFDVFRLFTNVSVIDEISSTGDSVMYGPTLRVYDELFSITLDGSLMRKSQIDLIIFEGNCKGI